MLQGETVKKYDTYKDSGIEWIGEIPQEWCIRKIKTVSDICGRIGFKGYTVNDLVDSDTNGAAIVLGGTNIMKDGYISYEHLTYISEFKYLESPEIMLHGGEILITKVGAGTGENAIYDYFQDRVTINPNVMLCKPENIVNSKFLNYFLLSPNTKNEIYLESNKSGAQPAINQNYIKNLYMTFPTIEEQQRIAEYLDRKCGEIDRVVETEKAVIEKLKEYKQSIITEAVTKGLDKSVPLKDSGIEWIGKIPQHWEVSRFKFLGKFTNGYAFPSDSFTENGIKVMKITNIQPMQISWEDSSYISYEWKLKAKDYIVPQNALVFALTRPIISGGIKVSIYEDKDEVLLNQRNAMFNGNNKITTSWLYYIMLNKLFIQEFNMKIDRTGQQPNISTNEIANIYITVPNINEQQQIVSYLDKKCSEIDKAIADKEQVIEKFTEYKKSLIYECITGKRKVV